jgi:hypothetical protein
MIIVEFALWEAEIIHFSACSRKQLEVRVDIPPLATVAGALSCIECSADKVFRVLWHGIWYRSCVINRYERQLSKNEFHWENIKTPVYQGHTHTLYGNGRPDATL